MGNFYSDELERGIMLLYFQPDASKYPEGVELIKKAAEKEEPDAFYFLARCYAWGDGGVKDSDAKAKKYSKRGIELGSDLCVLGADRFDGLHGELKAAMKHSLADSFEAVERKARSGDPMAQYAVGLFYYWQDISALQKPASREEYDRNEIRNGPESHKWFRMAAKCGCIPAFQNVYRSLAFGGNGIAQDLTAALAFVEEAKDYVKIDGSSCRSIAEQYEKLGNHALRVDWLNRGAAVKYSPCVNDLGRLYQNGKVVPRDDARAFAYFKEAAELGNEYGLYNIGWSLYNGRGVPENRAEAFSYFEKAAEAGHSNAQYFVSTYYFEGSYGVQQDYQKCRKWAEKSARQNNNRPKYYLGYFYLYGVGTMTNYQLALRYLTEFTNEYEDGDAYRCMGEIYDKGLGVPEDIEKAVSWYQKAVNAGCEGAKDSLGHFKKTLFGKWKRK